MLDQLKQRTKNLEKCKKHDFRVAVHKIEIDRIHFIICSYLRTCLHKIEQYTHCLLEREEKITDESMATISPEELRYAKEDEEVDLEEGNQHLIQYNPISHLLQNGSVALI
ncbi:DNA replication complex GINS protein SLD5-like isoform X2 [Oratosquilla oratoria]|uniref:DNA replication complex GINS protein SLD5-like isoform X2 n=1 Tax=Oratosquilla oratoria TaxID=337810 RepID=UPI003F776DC1